MRSTLCTLTKQTMGRVLRRTSTKQRSMTLRSFGPKRGNEETSWRRREDLSNGLFALLLNRGLDGTLSANGLIEVKIGGGHTSNEPRSAAESHVLDCPLNENQHPTLKLND